MFVSKALAINNEGHLTIGGCDCVELAAIYGTPLYVMDESLIRENCRIYKDALERHYEGKGIVIYASKAFCTLAMCKIVKQEGLGLDVVSGGELYTAMKAGFPADRIYFHGNNKTTDAINLALDYNIRRFVVDNREELVKLNKLARAKNKTASASFRIKPGIDAHTHDFVQTGQIDSKFGVALENGEALEIISAASKMSNISIEGIHCHIGSQIFDLAPFELAAEVMMGFIALLKEKIGVEIKELNLGGGYGIKYIQTHDPVDYNKYIAAVSAVVRGICDLKGLRMPYIVMEPGRSIVASAGITLYTVGSVKEIQNVRKYVSVDGGMTDNPRYALYQAQYEAVVANRAQEHIAGAAATTGTTATAGTTAIAAMAVTPGAMSKVTIAGKCCESGDLLAKDIDMPEVMENDIIAVLATGAYNYSMSSNYNRIPKPPVVLVKEGRHRIIVKREDYDDLIRNDLVPDDLKD